MTYTPKEKKPVIDFLKPQLRFKHLFEEKNKPILEKLQAQVDRNIAQLEKLCSITGS